MRKIANRYIQVKNYVLAGIGNGSWGVGERVPSENELVDLCKVSRMTARRALQDLLLEGTLVRIKGKGSYVAQEKQHSSLLQINSISNEIKNAGNTHRLEQLSLTKIKADAEISKLTGIAENENIFHSQVIHYQNQKPIQLEYRWVIPSAAPDYINQDFLSQTPSEYLTKIAPVTEAEHKIEAIIGNHEIRQCLAIDKDEAILLLNRTTWCGSQLVSYAKLFHPGDSYSFGTKFSPSNNP